MILLDTHVVIWSLMNEIKLGPQTRKLIEVRTRTDPFYVSAITAWEVAMLVKKGRLDLGCPAQDWLSKAMEHVAWQNLSIDESCALDAVNLPGDFHNDPADRFIIATARKRKLEVVTADRAILAYAKAGHVRAVDATL